MRIHTLTKHALLYSALALAATACGYDEDDKKSAPPPDTRGNGDGEGAAFALENGTYYIDQIRDLNDGCGLDLNNASDPATQIPFTLTNTANGFITIDFCNYEGKSLYGAVRGNEGTLSVLHNNKKVGAAQFDQECRMDVKVTADNKLEGRMTMSERNRNAALQQARVAKPECTTSFSFKMSKRD